MTAESATVPYDRMPDTPVRTNDKSTCCCCIPLRIGCFILGYINLVYNTIQTLCLLSLTTLIGVETHGFDHIDTEQPPTIEELPKYEAINEVLMRQAKILILMCCINVGWWLINVACLVGLHKNQTGPIRVYVGFVSARLILAMAGFIYLVVSANHGESHRIITHTIDIVLTSYFIFLYYIYANKLERAMEEEKAATAPQPQQTDISHIYVTKLDTKQLIA